MKKIGITILIIGLVLINPVFCVLISEIEENINLDYPENVIVGDEFDMALILSNFSENNYDIKIEILNESRNIAQRFWEDEWKSTNYWMYGAINTSETSDRTFRLKITENYMGINNITIKIKSSGFDQEFGDYEINITPESTPQNEDPPDEEIPQILLEIDFDDDEIINKEEFKIKIRAFNLENKEYDVKVYIYEDDKNNPLSQTYDEDDEWVSSKEYFDGFFKGPGNKTKEMRMRMKESYDDFAGDAKIGVRIKEEGDSSYKRETIEDIEILEYDSEGNNRIESLPLNAVGKKSEPALDSPISEDVIQLGRQNNKTEESEDIKTQDNIFYESKIELIKKYSIYGFALLCAILCILLFFKKLD